MKLRIGPPVTGEDFYPRPHLIQTITRALHGGHVAFLGPRRTGKTSCLKSIMADPPEGYVPLLLNLEKHHTIADWLSDMATATRAALNMPAPKLSWLKNKSSDFLKRLEKIDFHGIKLDLSGSKEPAWRPAADAFLGLLKESDAPLLFLLDYVLDALKHDGYLLQIAGGKQSTGFASNILRDYWRRKIS